MVVDQGVGEKPVGGSSRARTRTHARAHTHARTHWLGSSAHLQLLGLAPAPPLAVDALVTLPDEEHPGVSGVDETVGSLHGGLLEHSRQRVVLPSRQGCRPSRLNASQGVAGLASSGPLGPCLCQQYCPPRQHRLSPQPLLPGHGGQPLGTATPQPGPCRGRPWAWAEEGGVQSFRAGGSWHCWAPPSLPPGELLLRAPPRGPDHQPPQGLRQGCPWPAGTQPTPGIMSSREVSFRPQGCKACLSGLFPAPRVGCPALRYGDARPLPGLRASDTRALSWDSEGSRNVHPPPQAAF